MEKRVPFTQWHEVSSADYFHCAPLKTEQRRSSPAQYAYPPMFGVSCDGLSLAAVEAIALSERGRASVSLTESLIQTTCLPPEKSMNEASRVNVVGLLTSDRTQRNITYSIQLSQISPLRKMGTKAGLRTACCDSA